MAVIGEAGSHGDFRQRQRGFHQKTQRPPHTALQKVPVGRHARRLLERPDKMGGRQARCAGEVLEADAVLEVRLDIVAHALQDARPQTPAEMRSQARQGLVGGLAGYDAQKPLQRRLGGIRQFAGVQGQGVTHRSPTGYFDLEIGRVFSVEDWTPALLRQSPGRGSRRYAEGDASVTDEPHSSPSDPARDTASVRELAASFEKIRLTCDFTVSGEIWRVRAIRLLEKPWLIVARISLSRSVSVLPARLLESADGP